VTLTSGLLTSKTKQHIYELKYVCDQNLAEFSSLVFVTWCSQGFRDAQTHAPRHSLTDGQNRTQYASGTVFHKITVSWLETGSQKYVRVNVSLDSRQYKPVPTPATSVVLALMASVNCPCADLETEITIATSIVYSKLDYYPYALYTTIYRILK